MNSRQSFIFNHFKTLFTTYDGSLPFHHFFKKYCKTNSALGSKDRRILREIIYSIYRLGPVWSNVELEIIFLWPHVLNNASTELLKLFYGELDNDVKIPEPVYPFENELDSDLNTASFTASLLIQPRVWVRTNLQNAAKFKSKYEELIELEVPINEKMIAYGLANSTALQPEEPVLFEIQDLASQLVCAKIKLKEGVRVWDCCSGAGGKSLFLVELNKKTKLYCSDVRPSILENLKERFKSNRLPIPKISVVDVAKKPEKINFNGEIVGRDFFDVIIADVPCSGSGTWAREPENISFFKANKIEEMAKRQAEIIKNGLRFLKPGGKIFYITCSVFEKENSGVINELQEAGLVKIINSELVQGYSRMADNLFIAELEKE